MSNIGTPLPEGDPAKALAEAETLARIAKLDLETRSLQRQLRWTGRLMEWLKALAVPIALIGALIAYFVGRGQIQQAEKNRLNDRFDKALTRLGSDKPNDRVTGVSELRLFLLDRTAADLHGPALQFLVNAAALEKDPVVQASIMDVFQSLQAEELAPGALDNALRTAVERNRTLAASIRDAWQTQVTEEKRRLLARVAPVNLRPEEIPGPIPEQLLWKLPIQDFNTLQEANRGPFEELAPANRIPLNGLTHIITGLIKLGVRQSDFKSIYCERCDFTGAAGLNGVHFDDAYLARADFSHVDLTGATFRNADIGGAFFYASNLTGADLSTTEFFRPVRFPSLLAVAPYLDCARLAGADLSGTVLAGIWRTIAEPGKHSLHVSAPIIHGDGIAATTKMTYFSVLVVTIIPDSFATSHPDDSNVNDIRREVVREPLLYRPTMADHYRLYVHDNLGASARTLTIQRSVLHLGDDKLLDEWPKHALAGLFDQSGWRKLPLVSNMSASFPKARATEEQIARQLEAVPCSTSGHPSLGQLTVDRRDFTASVRP